MALFFVFLNRPKLKFVIYETKFSNVTTLLCRFQSNRRISFRGIAETIGSCVKTSCIITSCFTLRMKIKFHYLNSYSDVMHLRLSK